MNIAVISDGTFDESFYKKYIEDGGNTLSCFIDKDAELPNREYDVILLDYYNEGLDLNKIHRLADKYSETLFCILTDINIDHEPNSPDSKKELKLIQKLKVEYAFCFNVKNNEPKELSEYIDIMINIKEEDTNNANNNATSSTNVMIWVVAFLVLLALGLIHYLH